MAETIYIGNYAKGLTLNRLPFNIDNDAFPTMVNFYTWRGRAKRKRGTVFLGQMQIQIQSVLNATPPANWQVGQIALSSDAGNLLGTFITNITQASQAVVTITGSVFTVGEKVVISGVLGMTQINGGPYSVVAVSPTSMTLAVDSTLFTAYGSGGVATLAPGPTIVPGSIDVLVGGQTYTDTTLDGILTGSGGGTGTINYATGAIIISGGGSGPLTGKFSYYPGLPAMGLEDFASTNPNSQYPLLLGFDTTYAYQVNQNSSVVNFYNVSFYKSSKNPLIWSGTDYQQFWTTNYQNALWATNGKPGFHIVAGTYISGSGTTTVFFNFQTTAGGNYTTLVVGDMVWFNEWASGGVTINGITGEVTDVSGAASGNYGVTFDVSQTVSGVGSAQLLTSSIPGQDGIRWYDGDPTNGTGLPTGTGRGWVNFAPPLTATFVSINDYTLSRYYLIGAQMILPFKDRLVFFGVYIGNTHGDVIQLQDTVIWSWNGTPYYNEVVPMVPSRADTFDATAYYVDQTGKGGWLAAGLQQPIVTLNSNEDVLLVGFTGKQTRFVYTGDDLNPFLFFIINSELGASATFSGITLDRGALTIGGYGLALTDQQSAQRVDLQIPNSVFDISNANNGAQRVNSARDFFKEWVYFCYPIGSGTDSSNTWVFPTQTFLYNYREETWAILYENFTTQGSYRKSNKYTWKTIPFPTWAQWNETWNSASTTTLFPSIIGGTPQGYVLIKGEGTGEAISGTILNITASSDGNTQINSVNHCVSSANPLTNDGDFLYFQNAISTFQATITNISQATQAVVTAVNTFAAGQFVLISQVAGVMGTQINGKYLEIVSATGADFTVNLDTTTFSAYTSGGLATYSPLQNQIGKVIEIVDKDNFVVDIPFFSAIYNGLGNFARLSQPLLQTKQFPVYWNEGRQVRLCQQKYLLDFTTKAQITANIYLSQDPDDPWNTPANDAVIYSQTVFTCPESTNIDLTPDNINLQMPTASSQYQIWHRYNTSLLGDSFQIGLTLSEAQMRNYYFATAEISLHGMQLTVDKGPLLA